MVEYTTWKYGWWKWTAVARVFIRSLFSLSFWSVRSLHQLVQLLLLAKMKGRNREINHDFNPGMREDRRKRDRDRKGNGKWIAFLCAVNVRCEQKEVSFFLFAAIRFWCLQNFYWSFTSLPSFSRFFRLIHFCTIIIFHFLLLVILKFIRYVNFRPLNIWLF